MTKRQSQKPESLCMLIIDDNVHDPEVFSNKGYNLLEDKYGDIFSKIDRCTSFSSSTRSGKELLARRRYNLILLDYLFDSFSTHHNGEHIAREIRKLYGQQPIYITGVSTMWRKGHVQSGLVDTYAADPRGLFKEIDRFLKEKQPQLYEKHRAIRAERKSENQLGIPYGDLLWQPRAIRESGKKEKSLFHYDEGLDKIRLAGYQRYPRPWEVINLLRARLKGKLNPEQKAVANDIFTNSGEWVSMAFLYAEKEAFWMPSELITYLDPMGLVWNGERYICRKSEFDYLDCKLFKESYRAEEYENLWEYMYGCERNDLPKNMLSELRYFRDKTQKGFPQALAPGLVRRFSAMRRDRYLGVTPVTLINKFDFCCGNVVSAARGIKRLF